MKSFLMRLAAFAAGCLCLAASQLVGGGPAVLADAGPCALFPADDV